MNLDESLDTVVIGAGVVGLAVARAMAQRGRSVVVLERHALPAQETSARNSGVIHSGIYYPAGSLKARLCVAGRRQLYAYAEARGIAHQRCGKLIVCGNGQQDALAALEERARRNGVSDLEPLTGAELRRREPELEAAAGLWCPSTGIVDVHDFVQALIADIETAGGIVAYRTRVESVAVVPGGLQIACRAADEALQVRARQVVNSAGLDAVDLLHHFDGYPTPLKRAARYAKGSYFALAHGLRPFRHLVYPLPSEAGLGIHATLGLDGSTRFGPNVEWVERPDYVVDTAQAAEFYDAIRRYWPGLPDGALQPDYAGVRPKLCGPGDPSADFRIEGPEIHGCRGLVNLLGIESPGLTSSLAIGDEVADLLAPEFEQAPRAESW